MNVKKKQVVAIIISALIAGGLSGCGRLEQTAAENEVKLDKATVEKLDLSNNGKPVERSIDDICVKKEPLIKTELLYDEDHTLIQITEYEYDEKNRYAKVVESVRDEGDMLPVPTFSHEYLYDDETYTEETTYLRDKPYVTKDVYNTHNQVILTQHYSILTDKVETTTYSRRYAYDTDRRMEMTVYQNEDMKFAYTQTELYDEMGNKTFELMQYNTNEMDTTQFSNEYDEKGRLIHCISKKTSNDSYDTTVQEYFYTYDDNDRLVEKNVIVEESWRSFDLGATVLDSLFVYQYDDKGRLVTERKKESFKLDDVGPERKESSFKVYVY